MTIDGLLRQGLLDPTDARILIAHALQCSRVQLVIRALESLSEPELENIQRLFQRRLAGEPIAYITGQREFFGLPFHVTPAVLIPRPETELLVELAARYLPKGGSAIDLGTGSGAVAVALAHLRADARITASDISQAALDVAKQNAASNKVSVQFLHSDWYGAISGKFNLIVSNPPYIVAGDAHLSRGDLRFEPLSALTDHQDGLEALRRIVQGAPAHLQAGGWLLMEHGYDQADAVRALLSAAGWESVQSWPDLAGIPRVSGAQLPVN